MNIISFAWTTPAIVARKKTRTRRAWSPPYAAKFRENSICQAYDKGPRVGGKLIHLIRIMRDPWIQNTRDLSEDDYALEGFAYLDEYGFFCAGLKGLSGREFFDQWKSAAEDLYVVDFSYVYELAFTSKCAYRGCESDGMEDFRYRIPRPLGQMCAVCKLSCARIDRR